MSSSLFSLAILVSQASALAFRGPQATPKLEVGDLVFPPEPTAPPKVHPDLFRRQDVMTDLIGPDNTCGYISGLAGAGYGCNGATDKCAFFPSTAGDYGFVACCDLTDFTCGARITCVDYSQYYYSSACDNGCEKDTFTLKCTAATAPYCNGVRFPDNGVQDYFCDETQVSTWQTAYTTYSLENDGRAFSPITVTLTSAEPTTGTTGIPFTISQGSSPSQPTSSAAGSQGAAGQGAGESGASPTTTAPIGPTTSAAPVSSSSGAPIGAIVGGAVGGVAGLAIIAFGLYFMIRSAKRKDNAAANTNSGAPPPTYMPPQDPNSQVYAAVNSDKPAPSTQETPLAGQWGTGQTHYSPQMQDQQQQQYPPQEQRYSQQPSPLVQQQPYPNMAEVQGSYGQQQQQTQHQNIDPASYPQNQNTNPHYSMMSAITQPSPNPQAHMSAGFPDRGDTTSPMSNRQVSELSTPGGAQAPLSPSPTFVSNMGASGPTATHPAPAVEGRAEMSANMAGGPFPVNVYEFPGSETYNH